MRTLPFAALAIIALALTGCSGDSPRETPPAADAGKPAKVSVVAPGTLYERIMAAKKIRVGVKTDTPPFGVKKGESWRGFDLDIAQAVAQRLGVDVEFVAVTSRNRDDLLLADKVDIVVASMTITRYRDRTVDFSIPYFQDGQALLVPADSKIGGYLDLPGKSVGCVKGSTSSFYLKQVAPDAKPRVYPDFAALMKGLRDKEVEAITSDRLILVGLTRLGPDRDAFKVAGDRFTVEPYGIALPQDQSRLRDAVNEALMAMWEDGTWKTIADTWFGPGATYETKLGFTMPVVPK